MRCTHLSGLTFCKCDFSMQRVRWNQQSRSAQAWIKSRIWFPSPNDIRFEDKTADRTRQSDGSALWHRDYIPVFASGLFTRLWSKMDAYVNCDNMKEIHWNNISLSYMCIDRYILSCGSMVYVWLSYNSRRSHNVKKCTPSTCHLNNLPEASRLICPLSPLLVWQA